jgi:DNA-binding response OmpR family regulator
MSNTSHPKKIVIVEDNADLAQIYRTKLELIGYTCFIGYNGKVGLYFIQKELPDLVMLDLMVPDISGDQILRKMRSTTWGRDIPVFITSNLDEEEAPKGLRELGISEYLVKANLFGDRLEQLINGLLRPDEQPFTESAE